MMGERAGVEYSRISLSWLTLVVIVVIGIFSIFSLYLGFQAYGSENPDSANYYIIVGSAGFAAIGYMFFRTRAVASRKPAIKKVNVVTTLRCSSCNLKRVREFKRGDYIMKEDEPCTRCEGNMLVTDIHTKEEKKQSRRGN
jgi:hypothetical protein